MNVDIPRARRFPRRPIEGLLRCGHPEALAYWDGGYGAWFCFACDRWRMWVEVKRPASDVLTNEQFAIAD